MIPRLTDPSPSGVDAADAFHVVAPSLPGYGFSEPPRTPGWDVLRISNALHRADEPARLHGRYVAQGGDWGAQVTTRIGALDPEHCAAIHLNMALGSAVASRGSADRRGAGRSGRHGAVRRRRSRATPTSRAPSRRPSASRSTTRPPDCWRGSWRSSAPGATATGTRRTASPGSRCSPMSCSTGRPRRARPLPVCTGRAGTAAHRRRRSPSSTVPTGVARYPKEILRWPRSWVERQYNVVHWAVMARRRSLRRHGAARPVRRRSPLVRPHGALTAPVSAQASSGRSPGSSWS